jgi:hypothetical protein
MLEAGRYSAGALILPIWGTSWRAYMTIRNFSADTQRNYIRAVKNLAIFLGRSPDTATPEDLRLFQLHQTENRVRPPTINATVSALPRLEASDIALGMEADPAQHRVELAAVHGPNHRVQIELRPRPPGPRSEPQHRR